MSTWIWDKRTILKKSQWRNKAVIFLNSTIFCPSTSQGLFILLTEGSKTNSDGFLKLYVTHVSQLIYIKEPGKHIN